jgi:hypothetical protein
MRCGYAAKQNQVGRNSGNGKGGKRKEKGGRDKHKGEVEDQNEKEIEMVCVGFGVE